MAALDAGQRDFFWEHGYVVVEDAVDASLLAELRRDFAGWVEESRRHGEPYGDTADGRPRFDLEPGHSADRPGLRRVNAPIEVSDAYFRATADSRMTDCVADLIGPAVKLHHTKINSKLPGGHTEVKWHQDIQYWPHTNYSVLTIGVYLEDVDETMGPMGVIPGAHEGELFDLYDRNDCWAGAISDRDLERVPVEKAVYLQGPAGSVTVHHCRMIHGSKPNANPARSRPLLLNAFSSADAIPVTPNPTPAPQCGMIVRGKRTRWIHYDPRPCLLPPDWSGGYTSIFALQQGEEQEPQAAAAGG